MILGLWVLPNGKPLYFKLYDESDTVSMVLIKKVAPHSLEWLLTQVFSFSISFFRCLIHGKRLISQHNGVTKIIYRYS